MAVIKGGDMMLFVGGKSIGYATSHSLSISADTKETSSKDSGGKWQTSEIGILSWTAQSENLCANEYEGIGYDELFDYMIARKPIKGVFSLEGNSTDYADGKLDAVPENGWTPKNGDGYEGNMLITSLEKNAPNGDNATFTVQFTGTGALTKVVSTLSNSGGEMGE